MVRSAVHAIGTLVGFAIIACVVHASIMASGGYETGAAPLMLALGCGLGVGSIAVGMAWSDHRWFVTGGLIVALVAGEAYALILTAERTVSHREAQQAPMKADEELREKAAQRVKDAEAAVADAGKDTPRLARAIAAKKAADDAAIAKSAEKGCAKNCRALLEQQVIAASTEIENARVEAAAVLATAKRDLADARQAMGNAPKTGSASPLADRLGIAGWELDLTAAALASVAANGLAAMLVTFGVHGLMVARHEGRAPAAPLAPPRPAPAPATITVRPERRSSQKALPKPEPAPAPAPERNADTEADLFARAALVPSASGQIYLRDLPSAYGGWCQAEGRDPLTGREMAAALRTLFGRAGLHSEGSGHDTVIVGIDWKPGGPGAMILLDRTMRTRGRSAERKAAAI